MASARFAKTEKGHAEIAQRLRNLRGKLRTVLILVDATKSIDDIRQQAAQIGAPDDAIAQLVAEGYIAETGLAAPSAAPAMPSAAVPDGAGDDEAARFRTAKSFMNETIVDALGIRAFLFTMKLERCATRTDLMALLDDYATALGKKLDHAETAALARRAKELLGVS